MSAKEEEQPGYGSDNASRESGGSGGQRSMLELLSITDAAVKALNKSTRSQGSTTSQGSQKFCASNNSSQAVLPASGFAHSQGGSPASDRSGQSVGSKHSHISQKSQRDEVSHDSGVASKTQTASVRQGVVSGVSGAPEMQHDRSSDESTTASDVLIRSTLDKTDRSLLADLAEPKVNSNSSISSKCSRTSLGVNNFNSSGPQKVKISKKHLKKIKSPYEDDSSPRDSESSDGKVPSELLGKPSSRSGGSSDDTKGKTERSGVVPSSGSHISSAVSVKGAPRDAIVTKNMNKDTLAVEKVTKSADKPLDNVNIDKKKPVPTVVNDKERGRISSSIENKNKGPNGDVQMAFTDKCSKPAKPMQSTPQYRVERHTPQKFQPKIDSCPVKETFPEKRNLLHDLDDSIEIVTANGHNSSNGSSQPEIVTVQERIVTISAQSSLSPSSSVGENPVTRTIGPTLSVHSTAHRLRDDNGSSHQGKSLDGSPSVPPALARHFRRDYDNMDSLKQAGDAKWFVKSSGQGLCQGAAVDGVEAADKRKTVDVEICDFKLSEQQRQAKMTFARRQGGPVRRVVKPHIVSHDNKASSTSSTGEQKPQSEHGQANDQVLTAAAAASAAVAATQPFLKAQYEMEAKMTELLKKIDDLQQGKGSAGSESERVRQLERQVAEMTERRIEYMESLQAQQIAMQAKLLSMTRESGPQRSLYSRSSSPETHIHIHRQSGNKAFSKTMVSRQETKRDYSDNLHKYNDLEDSQESSPLDTPAPRSRAPKPTNYNTSEVDLSLRSRAQKGSPKARSRSPKHKSPQPRLRSPVKEKQDRGILHQILASSVSPEPGPRKDIPQPLQMYARSNEVCESPNVKKARELVEDLSLIEDQVKGLVADKDKWQPTTKGSSMQEAEVSKAVKETYEGPSPLDRYLHLPVSGPASPYKTVPDLLSSQLNAPVPQSFKDAKSILRQVQQNRGYLEANLESVFRGRQDLAVFNALETLYLDSNQQERCHIQKMVDSKIAKLRKEVEREVTDDMVLAEVQKTKGAAVPGAVTVPEPMPVKPAGRYGRGRLYEPKARPVEPRVVKVEPKKLTLKRSGPAVGKENYPTRGVARSPPKKTRNVFEDETYMTQVYGKANYQKGRTTVKDPYLHFQNTSKHKAQRPVGVLATPTAAKEVMSSKTQTNREGVRQFYFNPATGTYIPIASTAPTMIDGQLVPMAVPLGGPRMDSGLTAREAAHSHVTRDPRQVAQVTAASNVAMVTIGVDEEEEQPEKLKPELGKQVLPSVDIDTDASGISEILDEAVTPPLEIRSPAHKAKKHVQIMSPHGSPGKSPTKAHYEETEHQDDTNAEDVEDDEDAVVGLELPGYQPSNVPEEGYHGPEFPPKQPSADRLLTSDMIAEDIRRRDVLQNNAIEWIEQELMARLISEMYPETDREPARDVSHVYSEVSEDSVLEDQQQSMFVMDSIGQRGLQLFVDAGIPVNNHLVQQLVHEVLQEKVQVMLGERPGQEVPVRPSEDPQWEEPSVSEASSEPHVRPQQVQTPEPTPRGSPTSSPHHHGYSPAHTPVASPPPVKTVVQEPTVAVEPTPVAVPPPPALSPSQPMYLEPESEPESSASDDIQEELQRLAAKLAPTVDPSASTQSRHDVSTPPQTPRPEPEAQEVYRPLSPPPPSPRPQVTDEMMVSQRVVPAAGAKSPERSRGSSPKSASSPHVTEMDEEDGVPLDQPQPVIFNVAETQTDVKSRSPSPGREKARSRSPSVSSYTESSSISESFNENISEGQWLINKSDGEVADFPINEGAVRENLLKLAHKNVNVSSASTWKDAEDIDLDDQTEVSRSEGEFLYNYRHTEYPPEADPVLNLLARLQNATPQYGLYDMSNRQVVDVLNTTGKSEGEVLQVRPKQQQQLQQQFYQQPHLGATGVTRSSKTLQESKKSSRSGERRSPSPPQKRTQSPTFRTQSPTRVSFEGPLNDERPVSPTRGILKRSSSPLRDEVPVRDTTGRSQYVSGTGQSPTGRITPGGRLSQGRGMISTGGRTSPLKSSLRKPPQLIKSSTLPESRGLGARLVNVRGSSDDYRDSMDNQGSLYGSNQLTRSMTPDQMNVDALIQSGYMSQSFSQSEPMGLRGSGQSSLRSSFDVRGSRNSVGYSYGTEGSLTESELQRLATGGTGKLDVRMPGGFEESDLSEIDLTEG